MHVKGKTDARMQVKGQPGVLEKQTHLILLCIVHTQALLIPLIKRHGCYHGSIDITVK